MLKERIARKDELLQGYEKDLAKLRQAEKLVEQKHLQVASLSVGIQTCTVSLHSKVYLQIESPEDTVQHSYV